MKASFNRTLDALFDNIKTTVTHEVGCDFCGWHKTIETDTTGQRCSDMFSEQDAAEVFADMGWQIYTCKASGRTGISCPDCLNHCDDLFTCDVCNELTDHVQETLPGVLTCECCAEQHEQNMADVQKYYVRCGCKTLFVGMTLEQANIAAMDYNNNRLSRYDKPAIVYPQTI